MRYYCYNEMQRINNRYHSRVRAYCSQNSLSYNIRTMELGKSLSGSKLPNQYNGAMLNQPMKNPLNNEWANRGYVKRHCLVGYTYLVSYNQ